MAEDVVSKYEDMKVKEVSSRRKEWDWCRVHDTSNIAFDLRTSIWNLHITLQLRIVIASVP